MNYQKRQQKKRSKKIIIFVIFVILFFFGINKVTFLYESTNKIFSPILKIQTNIKKPFIFIGNYFSSKQKLNDVIAEKEKEIESLKLDILKNQLQNIEGNARIFEEQFTDQSNNKVAKVLSRPPYSPYDTLVLDMGEKDGVHINQKVLSEDIFIGYIKEVSSDTSIVQLISSSNVETPVRIGMDIDAIAMGRGGGHLIISLPKDLKVEKDQIIYVLGSKSYVVGAVTEISTDIQESFQTIYFNIPKPLSSLDFVEIVSEQ